MKHYHWSALGVDEIAVHKLRIHEIEEGREVRTAYFIDKPALENTIEI